MCFAAVKDLLQFLILVNVVEAEYLYLAYFMGLLLLLSINKAVQDIGVNISSSFGSIFILILNLSFFLSKE